MSRASARSISGKPSFAAEHPEPTSRTTSSTRSRSTSARASTSTSAPSGRRSRMTASPSRSSSMIHSAAFRPAGVAEIGQAGAKVVWSPLVELHALRRDREHAGARARRRLVSLGSDWAPSGSANLLARAQGRRQVNQNAVGRACSPTSSCSQMVTINGRRRSAWRTSSARSRSARYADLMVVAKHRSRPVPQPDRRRPQDVQLVTISGDPLFGDQRPDGHARQDRRLRDRSTRAARRRRSTSTSMPRMSPAARAALDDRERAARRQPEAHPRHRVQPGRADREGVRRHHARQLISPGHTAMKKLALAFTLTGPPSRSTAASAAPTTVSMTTSRTPTRRPTAPRPRRRSPMTSSMACGSRPSTARRSRPRS